MNKLFYLIVLSLFFLDFFYHSLGVIPRVLTWLQEILAMVVMMFAVLTFAIKKSLNVDRKYLVAIGFFLMVIVAGVILNGVGPGAIFIGMRAYFKHLPLFFLPLVYNFSEKEFKNQLNFILPLLLLQCPLSIFQRFIQFRGVPTGDVITGTLWLSGLLSITMISSIAVVLGLHLKGRISLRSFWLISFCLFVPTTINETKASLVLLPIALISTYLLSPKKSGTLKIQKIAGIGAACILFLGIFIPVYDYLAQSRMDHGIVEHFERELEGKGYFYTGSTGRPDDTIGRGDTLVLAYRNLSQDFGHFVFGYGMGNVMGSFIKSFRGEHTEALQYKAEQIAFTQLFWEMGAIGVLSYSVIYILVFMDSLRLRQYDDLFAAFALGWCSVTAIMVVCFAYINIFHANLINFLFWYFSGIVASKTFQMKNSDAIIHQKFRT